MPKNGISDGIGSSSYGTSAVAGEWYPEIELPMPPVFMNEVRNDVKAGVYPEMIENVVYTPADIKNAINNSVDNVVDIRLGADITVPARSDGKITTTFIPAGKTVNIDLAGHTYTCQAYAFYVTGGTLNLKGSGTIKTQMTGVTYCAINNTSGNVTIGDNVVIDTRVAEVPEGVENWMYGLVAFQGGSFTIKDNVIIHTDAASALSTNGNSTSGPGNFYVKGNAKLISDNCPAIYHANMADIVLTDNVVCGSIIARMGYITLSGNAKVVNNGYVNGYDDLGEYIVSSNGPACIKEGAIMSAVSTYAGSDGVNDLVLTIKDNATVTCKDGVAIMLCECGNGYDQIARVNSNKNLSWKVYSHAELEELATAAGKTLKPMTKVCDIEITMAGKKVYPALQEETPTEG